MTHLINGFKKCKLATAAIFFLIYAGLAVYCSGDPLGAALTWICALFFVLAVGLAFTRFAARLHNADIPKYMFPLLAVILGSGAFTVSFCFTARLDNILFMLLPLAIAIALSVKSLKNAPHALRVNALPAVRLFVSNNINYILLWAFLLLLYAFSVCIASARPLAVSGNSYPHIDFLWNVGNAKSFLLGFPPENIRFSEVRLAYHYFTELFWGGISKISGVDAYNIVMFFSSPLILAALIAALRSLGMLFYKESRKKTAFFVFVFLFGGCASTVFLFKNNGQSIFANNNLIHLLTNINSQATAVILLCGFTALVGLAARNKFKVNSLQLLITAACFVLLGIAKGPAAAIVLCSFLITIALTCIFARKCFLRAILLAGTVGAAFYVIYFSLFASGANNSVVLSPNTIQSFVAYTWLHGISDKYHLAYFGAGVICIVQAFLIIPLQLTLYLPVLWRDVKGLVKLSAERLLAHGCFAGGFLAYFLFWHSSGSQVYFLLIGIFYASLLAADFDFKLPRLAKPVYILSAGTAILTSICLVISMLFGIYRPMSKGALTQADEAALLYLNKISEKNERFATNRINSQPQRNDGISNVCTAISGRKAYLDGYTYEKSNMGIDNSVIEKHLNVNDALFGQNASAESIKTICTQNDIKYLVYFSAYEGSNKAIATACEEVYSGGGVFIYKAE